MSQPHKSKPDDQFIDDVLLTEHEAKVLIRPPSERVWRQWHKQKIFRFYLLPGTRQRRYSRKELTAWIRSGEGARFGAGRLNLIKARAKVGR